MIIRLAIACQLAYIALAVNFLHDETVWTKHTWPAFKLHFPFHRVLQSAPRTTGFNHVSELGPWSEGSYAHNTHSTYDVGSIAIKSASTCLCSRFHLRLCCVLGSSSDAKLTPLTVLRNNEDTFPAGQRMTTKIQYLMKCLAC